jgi:hypothetical protein
MLISPIAFLGVCAVLGIVGFVLAFNRKWTTLIPLAGVFAVVGITIVRMRDPLAISGTSRHYTETWDYIFWLVVSFVVGLTLPAVGGYVGTFKKRSR